MLISTMKKYEKMIKKQFFALKSVAEQDSFKKLLVHIMFPSINIYKKLDYRSIKKKKWYKLFRSL